MPGSGTSGPPSPASSTAGHFLNLIDHVDSTNPHYSISQTVHLSPSSLQHPRVCSAMAGFWLGSDDSEISQRSRAAPPDIVSDDDRSIAADSWSIKSDYGSTLDDDQRHADAAEDLSAANLRAPSEYSSDKEEPDAEGVTSMLGLQSYWDAAYADELANFREYGHTGEVW